MLRSVALAVFFVVVAILPAHAARAPVAAGKVDFVTGETWFIDASQQRRRPAQGDLLFVTDTISTGTDGEVHLDMEDGGYMAVRSNTLLKVQEFRARGDGGDRGVLNLVKGTLRSFTGWIARQGPKAYMINTVTATIGIRGTDHEPLFIPAGSSLGEPGTYDKVNEGATFIEHASGIVEVVPNTAGFAPLAAGAKARLLDRVPDFFRPSANEHLLAGRHKLVQDGLQEKLDARRRLNQSQPPESENPGGTSSELQETPLNPDTKPSVGDAPASTVPNIPPLLPPAGATAVPAPSVPAAVPGGAVAPALTSVPRPPAIPAAPTGGTSAVSPASAAPGVPAPPASTGAPAVAKPPASATVPAVPRTTRSEGRPSRVVPGAGRPEADAGRPGAESTKPALEDRTKALSERRRQQQEDRRGQFDRDRELGHKRDNE